MPINQIFITGTSAHSVVTSAAAVNTVVTSVDGTETVVTSVADNEVTVNAPISTTTVFLALTGPQGPPGATGADSSSEDYATPLVGVVVDYAKRAEYATPIGEIFAGYATPIGGSSSQFDYATPLPGVVIDYAKRAEYATPIGEVFLGYGTPIGQIFAGYATPIGPVSSSGFDYATPLVGVPVDYAKRAEYATPVGEIFLSYATPSPGASIDLAGRADYATPLLGVIIDQAKRAEYATPIGITQAMLPSSIYATPLGIALDSIAYINRNQTLSGINVFTTPVVISTGGVATMQVAGGGIQSSTSFSAILDVSARTGSNTVKIGAVGPSSEMGLSIMNGEEILYRSSPNYLTLDGGGLLIQSRGSATPLIVKQFAGQTVDLIDIQKSDATSLFKVTSAGVINVPATALIRFGAGANADISQDAGNAIKTVGMMKFNSGTVLVGAVGSTVGVGISYGISGSGDIQHYRTAAGELAFAGKGGIPTKVVILSTPNQEQLGTPLFQISRNEANPLFTVGAYGNTLIQTFGSATPLVIRQTAGQTMNLQEWQDSTSVVKASISTAGILTLGAGATIKSLFSNEINMVSSHLFVDTHIAAGVSPGTNKTTIGFLSGGSIEFGITSTFGLQQATAGVLTAAGQGTATKTTFVVKAVAAQIENLQEWQFAAAGPSTTATPIAIDANGKIQFAGSTTFDTNMYREGAGILRTDGTLNIGGSGSALQVLNGDIYAQKNQTPKVGIGGLGPSSQAAITFGSSSDALLFRSTSGALQVTDYLGIATPAISARLVLASGTTAAGGISMGDTTLYRGGISLLRTDGSFLAGGAITYGNGFSGQLSIGGDSSIATIQFGSSAGETLITRATSGSLKVTNYLGIATPAISARLTLPSGTTAGEGIALGDTNLYRSATDTLKTDDSFAAFTLQVGTTGVAPSVRGELFSEGRIIASQGGANQVIVASGSPSIVFGSSSDSSIFRTTAGSLQVTNYLGIATPAINANLAVASNALQPAASFSGLITATPGIRFSDGTVIITAPSASAFAGYATPVQDVPMQYANQAGYATPLLGVVIDKAGRAEYATPIGITQLMLPSSLYATPPAGSSIDFAGRAEYATPVGEIFLGLATPSAGSLIDFANRADYATPIVGVVVDNAKKAEYATPVGAIFNYYATPVLGVQVDFAKRAEYATPIGRIFLDYATPSPGAAIDFAGRADYSTPLLGVVIDKAGRAEYATPIGITQGMLPSSLYATPLGQIFLGSGSPFNGYATPTGIPWQQIYYLNQNQTSTGLQTYATPLTFSDNTQQNTAFKGYATPLLGVVPDKAARAEYATPIGLIPRYISLDADVNPIIGQSFGDAATPLNIAVTNGNPLRFQYMVAWAANAAATGARFSLNGPSFTRLAYSVRWNTTGTVVTQSPLGTSYDQAFTVGSASDATNNLCIIEGLIVPSAGGTLALRSASELNSPGSVTVKQGSSVLYW